MVKWIKITIIIFLVITPTYASAGIDVRNMETAFNEKYIPEEERGCYRYKLELLSWGNGHVITHKDRIKVIPIKYRYKIISVWIKKGLIFKKLACPHGSHDIISNGEYGLEVTAPDEYGQQEIIILERIKLLQD